MAASGTTLSQSVRIALEGFHAEDRFSAIEIAAIREGIIAGMAKVTAQLETLLTEDGAH